MSQGIKSQNDKNITLLKDVFHFAPNRTEIWKYEYRRDTFTHIFTLESSTQSRVCDSRGVNYVFNYQMKTTRRPLIRPR